MKEGTAPKPPSSKLRPHKLRAHIIRYATSRDGGEFWTWLMSDAHGAALCKGPLGFRSFDEAKAHARLAVATMAEGKITRRIEVLYR